MYDTKPELIGIYNNGVKGGGGGGGGSGATITITVPNATLTDPGVVVTGNTTSESVTSETVNVVPTMWWFQQEVARLDLRIDNAQGTVMYTKIAQYPPED